MKSDAVGRMPRLDGLRAIAVLAVLLAHGALNATTSTALLFPLGGAGVRLFFVLSGFLITGILLDQRTRADAMGASRSQIWRAFYIRRALRIFPLAYVVLAAAWIVGTDEMRSHGWWYVTYTSNILGAVRGFNPSLLGHFLVARG
jgi:peptidoglycan/LPS O-acetylase OafA/YrhL